MKMIRGLLGVLLVLAIAAPVHGKSLTKETTIDSNADSITVKEAVEELDDEFARAYGYINMLFRLQAAATCPATGNANYDVCLDTDGPTLMYWATDTWTELVGSTTEYSSGLSYGAAMAGVVINATLERDGTTAAVMVNGTSARPATVSVGGELLQVTSKVTHSYGSTADGTYYIYVVRTGSTSAFTLASTATKNGTDVYLGEVQVVGNNPVSITSYDQVLNKKLAGAFGATRTVSAAVGTSATKADYNANLWFTNSEMSLSADTFTPKTAGWYEIHATTDYPNNSTGYNCTMLYVNGARYAQDCAKTAGTTSVRSLVYLNGSTDYVEVYESCASGANDTSTTSGANAFWGRWIGGAY